MRVDAVEKLSVNVIVVSNGSSKNLQHRQIAIAMQIPDPSRLVFVTGECFVYTYGIDVIKKWTCRDKQFEYLIEYMKNIHWNLSLMSLFSYS